MATEEESTGSGSGAGVELKEEDIVAAMGEIPGYLDITPRDFKEIYLLAFPACPGAPQPGGGGGRDHDPGGGLGEDGHASGRGGRGHGPAGDFRGAGGRATACRWPGWSPKRISCGPWGWTSPRTS